MADPRDAVARRAPARLEAVTAGRTAHDVARLLRGAPRERREFPATAFLWTAGDRRVLLDTGYPAGRWRTGPAGWAYRRLLPPRLAPGEGIAEQVDPATVTDVVLTHLHPDHLGGLRDLPDARVTISAGAARTLAGARLRDGLLRGLVPPSLRRARVVLDQAFVPGPHGLRVHAPFDDDRWLLVDLPGHTDGHVGALVRGPHGDVLLAGDAAWGRDLLGEEGRMRAVPRLVGHDHDAQARTARTLLAAERAGVRLLFSHDAHPGGVDLLSSGVGPGGRAGRGEPT